MPLLVRPDGAAWARAGAELILAEARTAVAARGRFTLVLAGGSTPGPVYARLARPPLAQQMPWGATHLFWGDERCVAPDDPRSNYGSCRSWLEGPADHGLAPGQVHPIPGEISPPGRAAGRYEDELRGFFAGGC